MNSPGKKKSLRFAPKQRSKSSPVAVKPPRSPSDRLILAQVEQILPGDGLIVLVPGTALAKHLVQARPDVNWKIHAFEHFYLTAVVNSISDADDISDSANVELFCTPDLPEGELDTAVLPTDSRGSSELTRDVLQSLATLLKPSGRLIVSTNNSKDHWLHEHLKATFGRITVIKDKQGVCYIARKSPKEVKQKDFWCEFAFRDGEKLIRCASRPGVFSHRRIDAGARALIRSLDLLHEDKRFVKKPPKKIIEMGCGSGAVSTAAALRYPDAEVLAVDSHVRAVQSTERTAALNDVHNVAVMLTSDGNVPASGSHDLFLCNPPYYSDYRISELFLESAAEALRPGGRLHLVTKLTDWHQNRMVEYFANATVHRFGEYDVIVSQRG